MALDIKISLEGIGHALSDKKLAVPLYQRSYEWGEKHVRDLLQDISGAMRAKEGHYFLGTVVVTVTCPL